VYFFKPFLKIESYREKNEQEYWQNIENCRLFLDRIAKEKGFDPLHIPSWNSYGGIGIIKRVSISILKIIIIIPYLFSFIKS